MSRLIRYAKQTGYMTERYIWICGVEVIASRSPRRYYSRFNVLNHGERGLRSLYFTASRSRLQIRWTTIRGRVIQRRIRQARLQRIAAYTDHLDAL